MPSRMGYGIALLIVVVGIAGAGLVVYSRLSGLADQLPQIVVPGAASLAFDRPGTYTIYLESGAVVNGQLYASANELTGLRVRLVSRSGAPIDLTDPAVNSNYSIGGRSGRAVFTSTVSEPGDYELTAFYPDGRTEPQGVLAIGLDVPQKILLAILLAMSVGTAGFVVAVIVAVATFLRRRKAHRMRIAAPVPT